MTTIPVLCFVGRSGSGKTTLIEKLIPLLREKGIRVATIKHHNHDFEIDHEGKDTYRHKRAGAKTAMIVSPTKLALVEDLEADPSLEEIVARYVRGVDLVIVEGYKEETCPKIEVYNSEEGRPPVAIDDEDLRALVADKPVDSPAPFFLRDQVDDLSVFIAQWLGRFDNHSPGV